MIEHKPTPHGFRPHFNSENWKNKVQDEAEGKGKFCEQSDPRKKIQKGGD